MIETIGRVMTDYTGGGLRFHKVGEFVSVSASMDLRLIAWQGDDELAFVHADHHDAAYLWAERNKALIGDTRHLIALVPADDRSRTGEWSPADQAQAGNDLVETEQAGPSTDALARFSALPAAIARWLASMQTDDEILNAIEALAPEYQEVALLAAAGEVDATSTPSDIAVIGSDQELLAALALPSEAWRVFLHPKQRFLIDMPSGGHVLLRGGPGTGKTVVLAHRFARLLRVTQEARQKPPAFVALTEASRRAALDLLGRIGVSGVADQFIVAGELTRGRPQLLRRLDDYSEILVDEGQDLPLRYLAELIPLLETEADVPPHLIAFDSNQSIVGSSGEGFKRLAGLVDTITLNYSYRSTRQITARARLVLRQLHDGYEGKNFQARHALEGSRDPESARLVSGLSGPVISSRIVANESLVAAVESSLQTYLKSYPPGALGVIVAGRPDEAKGIIDELRARNADVEILAPVEAKGREFLAGVVVDPSSHEVSASITPAEYRVLTGLYVGISRFRDRAETIAISPASPLVRSSESG